MDADTPLPTLRGDRVLLRPPLQSDAKPLAAVLAEPAVSAWWHSYDLAKVTKELIGLEEPGVVIVVGADVVGWLQWYEESEPDYRYVALDIFLATACHGRGIGTEALRLLIAWHMQRGIRRFTIDPAAANTQAIRAYEAVGFRPVGIMREYERGADGTWHDGLLLDLLATEFR